MNERIKELALQANAHETGHAYYRGEKKPENAVTLHSVDLEKFAELIIKECLDQCYYRGMNDELYAGQLKAAAYIEEHFGVES